MKQKVFYFFSAFVSGAAVMAVEMTSSRLLAPYFGTSLFVWTNVIGVILVALALGYQFGGRLADRRPDPKLYFFGFLLTGLLVSFIPFFSARLLPFLSAGFGDLEQSLRWGSLLAVFLLVALPMFLFGMVVPFTVRLTAEDFKHVGSSSGTVSMVSTLGSLVGTFLPAFVLIPNLGTSKTFVAIGLFLILMAGIGLRNLFVLLLALVATGLFWVVPPVYAANDLMAAVESPYAYVFVTGEEQGPRYLHIDNAIGIQSVYQPDQVLPPRSFYYGYFALLPAFTSQPRSVLILGHAGGTFTRLFNTYYPELSVTGVELDPAVTALAKETMGLDQAQVDIVHADARQFLLHTEQDYDLILVDTYHGANIPAHLATVEFFELCKSHLSEGGLLALNAASTEGPFLEELQNTVAKAFGGLAAFPIPSSFNTMLVASEGEDFLNGRLLVESISADLSQFLMSFNQDLRHVEYEENAPVFHDEKLSEVDVKNEAMFMQLLSHF